MKKLKKFFIRKKKGLVPTFGSITNAVILPLPPSVQIVGSSQTELTAKKYHFKLIEVDLVKDDRVIFELNEKTYSLEVDHNVLNCVLKISRGGETSIY